MPIYEYFIRNAPIADGQKRTFKTPPAIQKTHKSITKGERTMPKGDQKPKFLILMGDENNTAVTDAAIMGENRRSEL